ncbi:MAG: carbon-nitrogen hydrolase family protein [bacterium]|nr:carbon-nitrogen hydrolase family protein [bacterium]
MRIAIVQLNSGDDPTANVADALQWIGRAADRGAELVALPETFTFCGPLPEAYRHAETIPGPTTDAVAAVARERGIYILAGSLHERSDNERKPYNTSVLIDRQGAIVATYRKIHLFDVAGLDMESESVRPGSEPVTATIRRHKLGLSICYDLRFPELYRELSARGAEILFVPSAFTLQTGRDHWEALLRARAIENLAHVVAPNQWGPHPPGKHCYGHSMIVDPWGTVLCRVPDGPGVAVADIEPARVRELREKLPALNHRRLGG